MNRLSQSLSHLLGRFPATPRPISSARSEQTRWIRVKVRNGNLEQAVAFMGRKMQWSGIERMIKREQTHHLKNSEKRVLARKKVQLKARSQELARKLQAILIKKVRGL